MARTIDGRAAERLKKNFAATADLGTFIAIPEAPSRPSRRPAARTPLRARARSLVMSGDVVNTFGDEFDGAPFREVVRALPLGPRAGSLVGGHPRPDIFPREPYV